MNRIRLAIAVCLAGAVALAPAAYAEGNGNGIGRGAPATHHFGMFPGAQAATNALLAVLHKHLEITSAQETAWQAFANAVSAQAADADGGASQAGAVHSAVDALNLQATVLRKQAEDAAAVAQTFTALYAVLTPAQRAVADAYFKEGLTL
jgi:Domain of Unknown Function (DUF1520).